MGQEGARKKGGALFFLSRDYDPAYEDCYDRTFSFWCAISVCVAHWVWPGVGPWTKDHRVVRGVGSSPPADRFNNYFLFLAQCDARPCRIQ